MAKYEWSGALYDNSREMHIGAAMGWIFHYYASRKWFDEVMSGQTDEELADEFLDSCRGGLPDPDDEDFPLNREELIAGFHAVRTDRSVTEHLFD